MKAEAEERCGSRAWWLRAVPEHRIPHVLVAEDDADLRALLAQAFRWEGYAVTECVDGPDLVSKLGTYLLFGAPAGFDLVVSDIQMPGATALEILEAMRECEGIPPVILITAFPSADTQNAAARLGVAAVFDKPFEIGDLVARAKDLLARDQGETL
jgi:DNA-binding response OmpR family regulator